MKPLALLGLLLAFTAASAQDAKDKKPAAKTYEGRPLKAWIDDLKDADPLVQEEAIEVLAAAGKDAKVALPQLKKLLDGDNPQVRFRAALAVWSIGGDARAAVGALSAGLKDASLSSRRQVLDILARIGPDAAPAVGQVIELLDDPDATVVANANRAISAMGKAAVPGLIKSMEHKEVRTRRNAVNLVLSLGTAGVSKDARATVTARLKDPDPAVRVGAARILFGLRQTDKPVIDALTEGLKSTDPTLRNNVLMTLQMSNERPRTLLPLLEEGLKSSDLNVKLAVARLLYPIEKKPARVLAIYTEALKGADRNHWSLAIAGLGDLGPAARAALPRLIELVKVRDYYNYELRNTLAKIGEPAIKPLVEVLKDTSAGVNPGGPGGPFYGTPQETALGVLGMMGQPAAKAVLPLLDDKDANVRTRAVRVIQAIGPDAKDAVSKLVGLLKDTNTSVRDFSAQALGAIGREARSAVPELLKLAKGRDVSIRAASFRALALIGPDKDDVLDDAVDGAKDNNTAVKQAALELLIRVDPKHKEIVPQVRGLIRLVSTRYAGLQLAGRLGDNGADLVPTIAELLKDPSDYVRRSAVDALGQIGPAVLKDKGAVDSLLEQLKRPDQSLQSSSLTALRLLRPEAKKAVPALAAYIKTSRDYYATMAIGLLGEYGQAGADGADALLAVLKDTTRSANDRSAAALALAQVAPAVAKKDGLAQARALISLDPTNFTAARAVLTIDPKDKDARAQLEAGLKNAQPYVRANAAMQIGLLGKAMKPLLPQVRALLKDPTPYTQACAALAMLRIGGETKEAVEVINAACKDMGPQSPRYSVAYLLADMGADGAPALPALRGLLGDPQPYIRTQAQTAISRIERAVAEAKKSEIENDESREKKDD